MVTPSGLKMYDFMEFYAFSVFNVVLLPLALEFFGLSLFQFSYFGLFLH